MKLGDKLAMYYNEEVRKGVLATRTTGLSSPFASSGGCAGGWQAALGWATIAGHVQRQLYPPTTPTCCSSSAGCCRARKRSGANKSRRRRRPQRRPSWPRQPARPRRLPLKLRQAARRLERPRWLAAQAWQAGMPQPAVLAPPHQPQAVTLVPAAACWADCAPRQALAAGRQPCSSHPRACSRPQRLQRCGSGSGWGAVAQLL